MDPIKHDTKLARSLDRAIVQADERYALFPQNARVLIAVSGGKDSWALAWLLARYLERRPDITLFASHIDLGFSGSEKFSRQAEEQLETLGIPCRVVRTKIGPEATDENAGKRPCFICTRRRREHLFETARQLGCGHVAFGHHRDDVLVTFLLNLLVNREISTMTPCQEVFDGEYRIVRPMYMIDEEQISVLAGELNRSFSANPCPVAGSTMRKEMADLLAMLEKAHPDTRHNLFQALHNVKPDFLPSKKR